MHNILGYLVQLVLATGVVLGGYALMRTSLRELLDRLFDFPAATRFYLRALLLLLLCAAWQQAIGDPWKHPAEEAAMEYVWDIADTIGRVLEQVAWSFVFYLVQITILTAVLRRKETP